MPLFVEVAVHVPGNTGTFDYHLPPELEGKVQPGCLVVVPFGPQRVQGVALRYIDMPSVPETRPVEALLDPLPVVTGAQMELAQQLSDQTLTPLSACLDLMLPAGISQQADREYQLVEPLRVADDELKPTARRIVLLLRERGALRGRQIEASLPHQHAKEALQGLAKQGVVISRPVLPEPGVHPKLVRMVGLACPPEGIEPKLSQIGRAGTPAYQRRKAMLDFLVREPWLVEAAWVYAASGGNLADLRRLEELGLVVLSESEVWRDPLAQVEAPLQTPPELTQGQAQVWSQLQAALRSQNNGIWKPYLLHGVTGSGKTEIYLRAVQEVLLQGKQALVLVPEIALTPQTVRRFLGRFPGMVGLVHSQLSVGERYDTWRRAGAGKLQVVVGPRSALFTPFPNLGLIVLDEFHDSSYYQSEPAPAYSAVQAAITYGRLTRSTVLLGSATPPVEWMYTAQEKNWPVLALPERIMAHRQTVAAQLTRQSQKSNPDETGSEGSSLPLPPVKIVDMRQELKAGNRSMFSRALQDAMTKTLDAGQQAILFLNRLGSATYVFCRDCGHTLRCPRCDRALTLHSDAAMLVCHTCGYRRKKPERCPNCGSTQIRDYGTGTERVEQEVLKTFPQARTLRWDSETTRQKGSHDLVLSHFVSHRADILIGTQMLAKGLDLPLVTLVGVILAEVGLYLDDFRAPERTFQLLTQVAGRAGRSPLGGQVVLQTYQPEQYAIQMAAGHDYAGFYRRELNSRREIGYPPFTRLVRLEYRHAEAQKAQAAAQRMAVQLEDWLREGGYSSTELIGPAPSFFAKQNGLYRWQIVLRGPDPAAALRGRNLGDWRVEVDPQSLL
ncbi:MAG TPA: primosomal protein N' [Anaerolineaceae bacterium]|nr:primosomal protein N' [Anaerolineaceae bacterium]